jgi:hypothetical protein
MIALDVLGFAVLAAVACVWARLILWACVFSWIGFTDGLRASKLRWDGNRWTIRCRYHGLTTAGGSDTTPGCLWCENDPPRRWDRCAAGGGHRMWTRSGHAQCRKHGDWAVVAQFYDPDLTMNVYGRPSRLPPGGRWIRVMRLSAGDGSRARGLVARLR